MKKIYTFGLIVFLLLVHTPAHSQQSQIPHFVKGKTLLNLLNGNSTQKAIATGYIGGSMDILIATGAANICNYKDMTIEKIENTTKSMLIAAPEFLEGPAGPYIIAAMRHHYSCDKNPGDSIIVPKDKIYHL